MKLSDVTQKKYFEIRPGLDALRYLGVYGFLTALARRVRRRKHSFFVQVVSNIDRHCLSEGYFEKGALDLLADVIGATGRDGLMIDVGGNIGNHAIGMAHLFDEVHTVEPHPVLFRVLEANILHNGVGNVVAHNFGLASEDTEAELEESADHHGLGRVKDRSILSPEMFGLSADSAVKLHPVTLRDAQAFVGGFGDTLDRAFIKIDVEGMEQEIVEAILPLLQDRKPIVAFEWFTGAQPELGRIAEAQPGYDFYGLEPLDAGRSLALRALGILFRGRQYALRKLEPGGPRAEVYTLALMIPTSG